MGKERRRRIKKYWTIIECNRVFPSKKMFKSLLYLILLIFCNVTLSVRTTEETDSTTVGWTGEGSYGVGNDDGVDTVRDFDSGTQTPPLEEHEFRTDGFERFEKRSASNITGSYEDDYGVGADEEVTPEVESPEISDISAIVNGKLAWEVSNLSAFATEEEIFSYGGKSEFAINSRATSSPFSRSNKQSDGSQSDAVKLSFRDVLTMLLPIQNSTLLQSDDEDDYLSSASLEALRSSDQYYKFTTIGLNDDSNDVIPIVRFDPLPPGDSYQFPLLRLQDGIFIFTYLGDFLSFIQPYDFPVEFLRDLLWKRISIISLIFQSLRAEAGFIGCVTVAVLVSLVIPSLTIASTFSDICVPHKKVVEDSVSIADGGETSCTRRTLALSLFILTLFLGAGGTAMIVTNEQLSSALLQTPGVLSTALNDASAFIRNTNAQLHHVTQKSLDKTLDQVYSDLERVEDLLGLPIQKQIATETGVDIALDALVDLAVVFDELAKKVAELQDMGIRIREFISETRDRLSDLKAQVDNLRKACPSKDRPLCDTIESSGLDITLRTDMLNTDSRLMILRSMAGGNLPHMSERVRNRFTDIPASIERETRQFREEIKRQLEGQRVDMDSALWPLESLSRDLRGGINEAREMVASVEETVTSLEQWRWLSLLFSAILVLLMALLCAAALIFSWCEKEGTARALLIAVLSLASLFSLILWIVAVAVFLTGGHGEVFLCRPLYDQPEYASLTRLLDDPGILYKRGGGFFKNLLPRNATITVPVKDVLNECEKDTAAYEAFELRRVMNIESASNFRKFSTVFNKLKYLDGNVDQIVFLDSDLQDKLQDLLQATAVNMTSFRSQLSQPVAGKDLNSFAKQLDSVANQIKDLATASRIETLAARTRRVLNSNIQPLEAKKEEIVYQVTTLEVLISPLQRQLNQSISHFKTIQFYLDNQGSNITEIKAGDYTNRLTTYLSQYRSYLLTSLTTEVAPCRPIFDIFYGLRHHICRQIMDPLNGFWFALVWSLLALTLATPVSLNIIHYYSLNDDILLETVHGGSMSTEMGSTAPVWSTPGPPTENTNW